MLPPPPEAPRARLARVIPPTCEQQTGGGFWRSFWRRFSGIDAEESAEGKLGRPFGLAVRADGSIVVADPDLGSVVQVEPNGSCRRLACPGTTWDAPISAAVAADGSLLVADAGAASVVRLQANGSCTVLGAGSLSRPTGVALVDGRIFVSDPPVNEVIAFDLAGGVAGRFGGGSEKLPGFLSPIALTPYGKDQLLVVDALNFRVVRIASDGRILAEFGEAGTGRGQLARPKGVAADGSGRIFVSDGQRDVILVFRGDGSFDHEFGESGTAPGQFRHPAGLAIAGDRLLVADSLNQRIQVFDILGAKP